MLTPFVGLVIGIDSDVAIWSIAVNCAPSEVAAPAVPTATSSVMELKPETIRSGTEVASFAGEELLAFSAAFEVTVAAGVGLEP